MQQYPIINFKNGSLEDFVACWSKMAGSLRQFPIFDQDIFRAYHFFMKGFVREIEDYLEVVPHSLHERAKQDIYTNKYAPFAHQLSQEGYPPKKIDEALWAFGKFLKSNYAVALVPRGK